MFQILDTATLLRLMDATQAAVRHTVETGEWSGCIWPEHPEWDAHEACIQVRSLAIHHLTVRHPEAEPQRHALTAQILASQACPQGGIGHLDADPLVDQAFLWLWILAGGPTPEVVHQVPSRPPRTEDLPPLPGGDPVAFTRVALAMLEALVYTDEHAARQIASTFLRAQPDVLAERALELLDTLIRHETAKAIEAGVSCADCGAESLELWYTGQTWGETLCEACYEARLGEGQARKQGL
ncbi:MAG: hypothetical protein AB7N91_05725 [Candidatus Tectimicrobiota bacterium]